jgi:hypothetical protein
MELNELRRLTLPKLRDLAKQETDLQGVIGMEKEDLIEAIAKAKGISYAEAPKDVSTIRSIKHEIHELRKQKTEILTSAPDQKKLKKVHRKVKRLKRLTRRLAHEAKIAPKPEAKTEEAAPPKEAEQATETEQPKEATQPDQPASPPPTEGQ